MANCEGIFSRTGSGDQVSEATQIELAQALISQHAFSTRSHLLLVAMRAEFDVESRLIAGSEQ
jgi:hypothetical protein